MALRLDETRAAFLSAGFQEIYQKGFVGARVEDIAARTDLSMSELRQHFPSKTDLGHAVIDEVIEPMIDELLIRPIETAQDPLDALLRCLRRLEQEGCEGRLPCGCPLNNLAQEMSVLDEGFRTRLEAVYVRWRETVADGLKNLQERGGLRQDVAPEAVAAFVVATIEGSLGTMKCGQTPALLAACLGVLIDYLEGLRVPEHDDD